MNKVSKRKHTCSLHACLKHILRLCRWSGHFLVEYVCNIKTMRYNVKSLYTVYFIVSFLIMCENSVVNFCLFLKNEDSDLNDFGNLMLGTSNIIETLLLYRFAKHWPSLVHSALEIEKSIAGILRLSNSVHIKCIALSYAVIGFSFAEHLLYSNFKLQYEIYCSDEQLSLREGFRKFLRIHYANFYNFLPFYEWIAIIAQFTRFQNAFIWNVMDVLGMCFSVYLTAYFQKLERIIRNTKQKNWAKIRACYSHLAILLDLINKQLAPFILLSSFYSLFFICKQLFGSINFVLSKDILNQVCAKGYEQEYLKHSYLWYYIFSLVFLAARSLGLAYLAANVHTFAYSCIRSLYEITSEDYSEEVECFLMQVRFNTIGLNGIFFYVKRQTILRVIATIITYELVLLQFSNLKRSNLFSEQNDNDTIVMPPSIY